MPRRASIATVVLAVTTLPLATSRAQAVGIDDIRAWVAAHQPRVYDDTAINTVVFVVDANGKYVNSLAAKFDASEVATSDLRFARMEELIDARQGTRRVDTLTSSACMTRASTASAGVKRPVCVLDGVRVDSFDPVQMLTVRALEVVNGTAAARYGAGESVAVLATSVPSMRQRLDALGVTPSNFDWLQTNRVRAGAIGPRGLDILILFLKGAAK